MAGTIDSLQIEIEASASDASKKIDVLSASLAKLKANAKGGAGLNALSKQIRTLGEATNALTNGNANKLAELAKALQSLSNVQKSSGLSSTINTLNKLKNVDLSGVSEAKMRSLGSALNVLGDIQKADGLKATVSQLNKIPQIMEKLDDADLSKFAKQMQEVTNAVRPLANEMDKVAKGFDAFPAKIQKLIKSTDKLSTATQKPEKSFSGFSNSMIRFGVESLIFDKVTDILSDALNESNDYVENLNLFTVSMGKYAESAKRYAEEVQAALGIDPSEWMRNQGIFMQIATGFGVVADKAALMSKNLTQIGYDISSFYNISTEEAMLKVQSGISGELEPLRRLGYALDVATLQQIAYNHGITQSINTMTQAQKSQLRYLAIMEQSGNVMGDLSRTVLTPANSLRILQQQITQLSRAIGNLMIPFLIKVIPYVQAFVEVLTEAIQALALLVGFELPEIDYSGIGNVSTGAGEAEDALNGAADAAKKLKDYTLGIDELNIISPDTGAGSGGSGGAGGGYDLPLELPEYDFLGNISEQTDDLKEKMRELLYDYIIPIGASLLAWKVTTSFAEGINEIIQMLSKLPKSAKMGLSVVISAVEFMMVKSIMDDFFADGGGIWDLLKAAITTAAGSGILYALIGTPGLVLGLSVGAVAVLTSLTGAIGSGLGVNSGKAIIGKYLAIALGGLAGFVFGGPAGAMIGIVLTAGLTFSLTTVMAEISGQISSSSMEAIIGEMIGYLAVGAAGAGIGFLVGGPVGALVGFVIGSVVTFALQEASIDFGKWYKDISKVVDGVKVLGDGVSKATKQKMEPFLKDIQELDRSMKELEWGNLTIDESVVESTKNTMGEISKIITDSLDADKNGAREAVENLKGILGEDMYSSIIDSSTEYYDNAAKQVENYSNRINEIMQNAADEKRAITSAEWQEIHKIESDMQDLGIKTISDTQVEYETIMRNLKDNSVHISLEQSSEIIKNAMATKDEAIKAAEEQYSRTLLEAQKMYEAGAINDEQYQAIRDAALLTKDEAVQAATDQYQSIYDTAVSKLGDLSKYIDSKTGDIKSKWTVFWEDLGKGWSDFWQDFSKRFKYEWDTFWIRTGNIFIAIWNGIVTAFEWAINGIISMLNMLSIDIPETPFNPAVHIGFDIPKVSFDRIPELEIPAYAMGGFPEHGQLFIANESGPELVGKIGNRTAVANNDQIEGGIQRGVEEANASVVSVLYQLLDAAERIAAKDNTVYIGDEEIGTSANRYNSNRGYNLGITT